MAIQLTSRVKTQADLISIPVYRPKMRETTALGAAIAAGLAVGLWHNFTELRDINRAGGAVFEPTITREESASKFGEWEKAVRMSKGWVGVDNTQGAETNTKPVFHAATTNGTSTVLAEKRDPNVSKTTVKRSHSPLVADLVAGFGADTALKVKTRTQNGNMDFPPARTPLISISGDLDDADEEDLFLELRKVEILQKLKKLRKLKLNCY